MFDVNNGLVNQPYLQKIGRGNANKEIAARLSIPEETVKSRVRNVLAKLGATTEPAP